ncbi:MAG TPA: ABC transporter ATP-binding protein [Bacilli bacterium]
MIEIRQAVKKFGKIYALNNATCTIERGRIVGVLGINGAGKSTMLKAIAGLIRLHSGEVQIDGDRPSIATRKKIAYLPEIDVHYSWMTVGDAMAYFQDFYGDWDESKANHLLDYFQLNARSEISRMSKGTRAKTKLLLALSRKCEYLLLDEPLSGIDVLSRENLLNGLVADFAEEGQTIVITTHEVKEVEAILDDVLFIRDGEIVLKGNLDELKQSRKQSLIDMMKELYVHETV